MIKTDTSTETNTTTTIKEDIAIMPPENYDVLLLNDNTVNFMAVWDVLSVVLQITRFRAMQIALQCHLNGKAIVFTGPRDLAQTYLEGLRNYAAKQAKEHPDSEYLGYGRMAFDIEKKT